jgi:uncharacterized damage-inducible protein DinB
MEFTAGVLRTHLDYSTWASRRLVDAASVLQPEELTRDFGTADHSVLGTLVHVYAADRVWLGRIRGNPPARFLDPDKDMRMEVLRDDWPPLLEEWRSWAADLTDESVGKRVQYKDLKGNPYETPLWQIVLHVVNHGTHHRGQVSGFLRTMGHTPPPLDLMAYYRVSNLLR